MKRIKSVVWVVGTLIAAVVGGVVAAAVYRRLRHLDVPVEEADVFFDIGFVFYLGFATVIAVATVACILRFRKGRAFAGQRSL